MKEIAAREAKNRFGHLLDAAQNAPVRVTRKGHAVGVMMSVQQYGRLRGAAWEHLTATMDALGEEASAKGLTKARLEALLADAGYRNSEPGIASGQWPRRDASVRHPTGTGSRQARTER